MPLTIPLAAQSTMGEDAPSSPERQTRSVTNNGGDIGGNSGGTAESLVGKASSKKSRLGLPLLSRIRKQPRRLTMTAAAKKVSKATTKAKKEKAIKRKDTQFSLYQN